MDELRRVNQSLALLEFKFIPMAKGKTKKELIAKADRLWKKRKEILDKLEKDNFE